MKWLLMAMLVLLPACGGGGDECVGDCKVVKPGGSMLYIIEDIPPTPQEGTWELQ